MCQDTFPPYEAYVKLWKAVIVPLLGWSESQVERWAEQFRQFFDGNTHEFHRHDPLSYVAAELLPKGLLQPYQGLAARDIEAEIETAISDFVEEVANVERLPHADWQPVKDRIDALLRKHGDTLNDVVGRKKKCYW